MDAIDSAVVTAINHGLTDTLIKSGLQPDWINSNDVRLIYKVAVDLTHRLPPVKPNKLNLLVATSGQLQDLEGIKNLFSLNGTGEVPVDETVKRCRDRFLLREYTTIKSKAEQLALTKPTEIREWLPNIGEEFLSLSKSGKAYNALPSAHKGSIVAPVAFKSCLPTLNRMFEGRAEDGGGYRLGWWVVWLGITGRGKTTMAYTMAVDAIRQAHRVVFISKENQGQIRARVLMGLTDLTVREIETDVAEDQASMFLDKHGNPLIMRWADGTVIGEWHKATTRQFLLNYWAKAIECDLRLYDWSFFNKNGLQTIISIDAPTIINGDYIDANDGAAVDSRNVVNGLGRIGAFLEEMAHTYKVHINGFFQVANDEKKGYEKNDTHEIPGPYGSGMVSHTADQRFQTKWHRLPDRQHFFRTKCRAGGLMEEFTLRYHPRKRIYIEDSISMI